MGKALEWLGAAGCRGVAMELFENAKEAGDYVAADCPLTVHATPDSCFRYYYTDDRARCFACDATTDLIGAFNALQGRDVHDADGFRLFRERYAAGAPTSERRREAPRRAPESFVPAASVAPDALWQGQALKLAREAHAALLANPAGRFMVEASGRKTEVEMGALDWLREQRGLTLDTVRRFGLGWIGERIYKGREAWGLPPKAWENGKPRALCIKRGLLIPTFGPKASDGQREILRLRVRLVADESGPKYQLVDGSRNRPVVIGPRALAHLVEETELDGMLVAQEAGDLVGVVMVGAAKLQPQAAEHEILASSRCLLVAMDAGETPSDWGLWLAREILRRKRSLRVLRDQRAPAWLASIVLRRAHTLQVVDDAHAWVQAFASPARTHIDAHAWVRAFARPRFRGAGAQAGDWWLKTYPQTAKRWPVPEGKDIGEFWGLGGSLRTWILAGLPAGIRFMIERRKAVQACPAPTPAPVKHLAAEDLQEQERPTPRPDYGRENRPLEDAPATPANRSGITPGMLRGWRRARAFLMPRLPELLDAGWTRPDLFRVGRGRWPWGWGQAWRPYWQHAANISLAPGGVIAIELHEAGRVIQQHAHPHS